MPDQDALQGEDLGGPARSTRPTSLLLAFCGAHMLGRPAAASVGGVIGVLGRLGVGEHAVRATLNRMTRRGFLTTSRQGRRSYLSLTLHAEAVLQLGGRRLEATSPEDEWDGRWTLLAFSVPEERRSIRHTLRTQLTWAGFGPLQNGLWVSPSPDDIAPALSELGLLDYVRIFRADALTPADPQGVVTEAWDVDQVAARYRDFLRRWETSPASDAAGGPMASLDALSRQILLETEWLLLMREDPRLPRALLPTDWPGAPAEELFWHLRRELAEPARELADSTVQWVPLSDFR